MVGKTNVGGGGGSSTEEAYAYIHVTYPSTATSCTASKIGGITLTAQGTSNGAQGELHYVFCVPESGTWNIEITNGATTKSDSCTITMQNQIDSVVLYFSRLPEGYREVEYLETYKAWFNTGYALRYPQTTEIDFAYMIVSHDGTYKWIRLFGTTSYGLVQTPNDSGPIYKFSGSEVGSVSIVYGEKRTVQYNTQPGREIIENGTTIGTCQGQDVSSSPLYLGTMSNAASSGLAGYSSYTIRFYEYVVKVAGEIVQDLVPCKNSQDALGFYDLIGETFIQDTANAGGTVTAGPYV